MNSGTDVLGKFYEVFLKYGNGAKEIGIVLTPRHVEISPKTSSQDHGQPRKRGFPPGVSVICHRFGLTGSWNLLNQTHSY